MSARLSIPLDTLGKPMPIPVPSGWTDHSSPREWRQFWLRHPSGTGPLPRRNVEPRAQRLDFSVPVCSMQQ